MEAEPSQPRSVRWPYLLIGVNLPLGLVLWLGLISDLSWTSDLVNTLFPPLVGLLAFVSWPLWRYLRPGGGKRAWLWQGLVLAPSLAGGLPYVILGIVALIPPILFVTMMSGMFMLGEQINAVVIQEAPSPAGDKTAVVTFYGVGAYGGGNGHISVDIRYPYLPFVRRDVYYLDDSYEADGEPQAYVTWLDERTLHMSEEDVSVDVGSIHWQVPGFIQLAGAIAFVLPQLVREFYGWPGVSSFSP
jgi:hypothetical protein